MKMPFVNMKNSGKQKIIWIALLLVMTLNLNACGTPPELRKEAKQRLQMYEGDFRNKVISVYGSDAKLKNVDCPTYRSVGSPVPEANYSVSERLTGKINIGMKSYEAEYYPDTGVMKDTVHTKLICNKIVNALPIDDSKISRFDYNDPAFEIPKFDCMMDTLDKAAEDDILLYLNILTVEDLSNYKDHDFESIPEIQKIIDGNMHVVIKMVSLKDTERASALCGSIHKFSFSYHESEILQNGESVDPFDYYHIRNTIRIEKTGAGGTNGELKVVYLE